MATTMAPRTSNWAVEVASRMKGATFPLGADEAKERLRGMQVDKRSMDELLEGVHFPVKTPAELLKEIKNQLTSSARSDDWAVVVAEALEGAVYPLTMEEAARRLRGILVHGQDLSLLVVRLHFPCASPVQLLDQIEDEVE